jgi:hypothetical protein
MRGGLGRRRDLLHGAVVRGPGCSRCARALGASGAASRRPGRARDRDPTTVGAASAAGAERYCIRADGAADGRSFTDADSGPTLVDGARPRVDRVSTRSGRACAHGASIRPGGDTAGASCPDASQQRRATTDATGAAARSGARTATTRQARRESPAAVVGNSVALTDHFAAVPAGRLRVQSGLREAIGRELILDGVATYTDDDIAIIMSSLRQRRVGCDPPSRCRRRRRRRSRAGGIHRAYHERSRCGGGAAPPPHAPSRVRQRPSLMRHGAGGGAGGMKVAGIHTQ